MKPGSDNDLGRIQATLRDALQELLMFSPNRKVLAHRALPWAVRLAGGESGVLVDEHGGVMATHGIGYQRALGVIRDIPLTQAQTLRLDPAYGPYAIVRPLEMSGGMGALIVIGGPSATFAPGQEAILDGYAASVTNALDRAELFDSLARQEREIRAARDTAQSANRAKSEFLSRMSHELRTPLTAMIGFAELLEIEELTAQQHEYVETILRAGSHLLELMNDILDIARIEEGRMSLVPEAVLVADVAREVSELVKPSADRHSITLKVDVDDRLTVIADRQRLRQVLVNFMSNGVKYNHDGGCVTISARQQSNDTGKIVVADTGMGMSSDDVDLLFSPFNRLWAQRSDIEGTGLGLALSKTLAEAMHGNIGVSSKLGSGSEFWVELPLADTELIETAAAAMERGPANPPLPTKSKIVLLAEDAESNIKLVKGILRRRPHVELVVATNGVTAIEMAKDRAPDLILLDLHLPDIDGDEVMRQLQALAELRHTPVVIVSADATDRQRERLLEAGAKDYITKPLRLKRLLQVVDTHLADSPVRAEPSAPSSSSPR
jgi:signal transduction histidine kinase/CheY-like chemotaxis protein